MTTASCDEQIDFNDTLALVQKRNYTTEWIVTQLLTVYMFKHAALIDTGQMKLWKKSSKLICPTKFTIIIRYS